MTKKAIFTLLFVLLSLVQAFAQESQTVSNSKPRLINLPKPQYVEEAKSAKASGKVDVAVKIDEQGNVIEAKAISGNKLLWESAIESAKKAKFEPTLVKGKAVKVDGIISYNFVLTNYLETYSVPNSIDELSDVTKNEEYFESLVNLIDNYKIGFGFGDKKFHAETPLTRGDFCEFLYKTLILLDKKATLANKNLVENKIFYPNNDLKLSSINELSDVNKNKPYFLAVKGLLEKYNVVLIDENSKFNGEIPLFKSEVDEIWRKIFGDEAMPINFDKMKNDKTVITRGEFVIFLNESLEVLTYKTLP
jgi:TonB family protein